MVKTYTDNDLENAGIMAEIENKLYPMSAKEVEGKVRKAIVLAFNKGVNFKGIPWEKDK